MAIETAFEIRAESEAIWDALWSELGLGEDGSFSVEGSTWPKRLSLRVTLSGVPCVLSYSIEPNGDGCEVTAKLEPSGLRYMVYQATTFGHFGRNYKFLLATGLANLKQSVEAPESEEPGAEAEA